MAVPLVAIVGRPNVGKSSLFNWIAGKRIAIVDPTAGVTRDRVTTLVESGERFFELTDTGGMGIQDVDNLTDLVEDLGCEPMALAQASGVISTSSLSCRDYQGYFTARRDQLATTAGSKPPAAAVSWLFSVEQADRLAPGGAAQPVLALAALLDGHGMPATVFSSPAAGAYLASDGTRAAAAREQAWSILPVLERTALLGLDRAASPPVVRMSPVIQAASGAPIVAARIRPMITSPPTRAALSSRNRSQKSLDGLLT